MTGLITAWMTANIHKYNSLMPEQLTPQEISRYSRQIKMPEIGLAGQEKLKSTSVLIIGAGGLGSPVALYLAAAGIGRIGLVDDDVVELSNLQRQVLHDTPHTGHSKAVSGRERLTALNPHVRVEAICDRFTDQNAEWIADGYDILVDCSDNFPTRYLINNLCVRTKRPDVYGAVEGFQGQVSVFDARHGPCLCCVFPEVPPSDVSPDFLTSGVLGVLPGVIGSLQAVEVLKLALELGRPLYGSLILYDAPDGSFQKLKVEKRENCLVCG